MAHSAASNPPLPGATVLPFADDHEIWASLQSAIASSSGFQRWKSEQPTSAEGPTESPEILVRRYLRETLATLAY